jgi:hypothetical protein
VPPINPKKAPGWLYRLFKFLSPFVDAADRAEAYNTSKPAPPLPPEDSGCK